MWALTRENLGFRQSEIQTSLFGYRDKLQNLKFAYSNSTYMILFNKQITKVLNQTVGMCRLVCAFVIRKPQKTGFLAARPMFSSDDYLFIHRF